MLGILAPVRQALLKNDIAALSGTYRNFFRDPFALILTKRRASRC